MQSLRANFHNLFWSDNTNELSYWNSIIEYPKMFDIDQYLISIQRLYDTCGPYLMINYAFKFTQ